jgi:alpha-glucosidase (family GH31 glycosyl hydrolase)
MLGVQVRAACAVVAAVLMAPPVASSAVARVRARVGRVTLATTAAVADVRLAPFRVRLADRRGRTLVAEPSGGGAFWERAGRVHELGRGRVAARIPDGVELRVATDDPAGSATVTLVWRTPRTLTVTVAPAEPAGLTAVGGRWRARRSERFYGLTERLRDSPPLAPLEVPADDAKPPEAGTLDRRGETVEMLVRPTYGLYAPFYHSSAGYGLAVGGTAIGTFDLAQADRRTVAYRFETGNAAESRRLVVHLFVGPEHATILDEYTALTGRPFVPPAWAFTHIRWRDELPVAPPVLLDGTPINATVAEDVLMYEKLGIQPGVYHFDRPVQVGEFGFARFALDEERLPNAIAMLASLRARRYRLSVWSAAWTCGAEPGDVGLEAQAAALVAPGPGGPPHCADGGGASFILDVTNPAAQAFFREKLRAFVSTYGFDAIKLDRGEEHIPSAATDVWADGRNGREVRNAYPVLQAMIHHDALAAARPGDFMLWLRAGYTGAQRWGIAWGGDIPGSEAFGFGPGTALGLRSAIVSQQRAAFMGYPVWGSDTGGYYQFKDREVFARWLQFSAFSGLMEIGGRGTHAPWDMPTAPAVDEEMIQIYKRYTDLRVTLRDYIAAAARAAAERGLPIVRPLVFQYRHDRRVADRWDQYLFGPDLMVAPVWRVGERRRSVYFPRGRWRSFWNEAETYRGPKTATVDAPLGEIPLFIRDDARVP